MNKIFFLLPILVTLLFIPGIAEAYRGLDYEKIQDPETGSITFTTGLPKYIHDGSQYVPFIFSDLGNVLQVETNHGSVQLDKTTCEFSYYNNGLINATSDTPLFTDKILAYQSTDQTTWNAVNQVNNAACTASWNGSELTATKSHSVGILEYKFILNEDKWKTQLEVTNLSGLNDRYFGFAQILNLNRDTINYGGSQKNLDNFDGQTFDRTWLENNEGKVIDLLNGFYFDFDLAFDNLGSVDVVDTGVNKSRLIFAYDYNSQLLLNGTELIYDPTFGQLTGNKYVARMDGLVSANCSTTGFDIDQDTAVFSLWKYDSANGAVPSCSAAAFQFDISNIPDSAEITDVSFEFEIDGASSAQNCDINQLDINPSTLSDTAANAATLFNFITNDTTDYVTNDATCSTTGQKTIDLGTTADTDLETRLTTDNIFPFGMHWNTWDTRDGSSHGIRIGNIGGGETDYHLVVTYDMPPDVVNKFNATTIQGTGVFLEWIAGTKYGGSGHNCDVDRWNGVSWVKLAGSGLNCNTNPNFTDTSPIKDVTTGTMYRVRSTVVFDVDSEYNLGTFPMPEALHDNLLSKYTFDWVTTDSGLLDNDGTVTGNELYQNDTTDSDFPRVGFDFDGSSDITLGSENSYDFNHDEPFSYVFEIKAPTGNSAEEIIISKGDPATADSWIVFFNNNDNLYFRYRIDSTSHNFVPALDVRDSNWHFIAITYDGSSDESGFNLYHNGVLFSSFSSGAIAGTFDNANNVIIGDKSATGSDLTGQLDDVLIFDTELTADQVADLYNTASTPFPRIPTDDENVFAVTDLTATATSLSSVDLTWSSPVSLFASITGYQINFTTPFGDPQTIIVNDTESTTTSYEVTGISVGGDYSFRIGTYDFFNYANYSGNIANATTFSEFTIGELEIETGSNPQISDVLFTETPINTTHTTLTVQFPTASNMTCMFTQLNSNTNNTFYNLDSSVLASDTRFNTTDFTLITPGNQPVDVHCEDVDDITVFGDYVLTQSSFPFLDLVNGYRQGTFGTAGEFGVFDLITFIVIIASMIGFNKSNPAAGLIIAMMILGGSSFLGIITLPTILFSILPLIIMFAIVVTRK